MSLFNDTYRGSCDVSADCNNLSIFLRCFSKMDVGAGHNIPNSVVLILHDTIVQLGQCALELNAAGSKCKV